MKYLIILIPIIIFVFSCSVISDNAEMNTIDTLTVYSYDYDSSRSCLNRTVVTGLNDSEADLIIGPYKQNNMVFLSPSKDTSIGASDKTTGIQDIGSYPYSNPPAEGYYDMEYINKGHYYFVMFEDSTFARIYVNYFDFDSIIFEIDDYSDNEE